MFQTTGFRKSTLAYTYQRKDKSTMSKFTQEKTAFTTSKIMQEKNRRLQRQNLRENKKNGVYNVKIYVREK